VRGASVLARASKRFRAPAGARVTFLLRGQEKSNPKRRPPRGGASRASMHGKSVSRGRAFRAGSCPREKALPSLATPAARPDRPRLTAAEGPRKSRRASCAPEARARAEAKAKRRELAGCSSLPCMQGRVGVGCCCFCAQERAALPGAPMARRAGGGKSAGWPAWMPASFPPAQGCAVGKPRNPPAHPEPMDGRRACHRGAVSLWLLSLWASKEKVARAPAGVRNRFEARASTEAEAPLTPTLSPNDEAVGGEGGVASRKQVKGVGYRQVSDTASNLAQIGQPRCVFMAHHPPAPAAGPAAACRSAPFADARRCPTAPPDPAGTAAARRRRAVCRALATA